MKRTTKDILPDGLYQWNDLQGRLLCYLRICGASAISLNEGYDYKNCNWENNQKCNRLVQLTVSYYYEKL
jgi:hypothetical protein